MISNLELLEYGEGLLVQLGADGDVGNVRRIVVVQPVDILHHLAVVRFDSGQDEQVLQVPTRQQQLLQVCDKYIFAAILFSSCHTHVTGLHSGE